MRIIGGKYKGRLLKGPKSSHKGTRPTTDRVRESLFNIIAPYIRGARFLDLYAGTSAVGLEALSRGAKELTVVERDRQMVRIIKSNLKALGIEARIFSCDVTKAIEVLHKTKVEFDIIFADPPYHLMVASQLMRLVEPLLSQGGLLIIEHGKNEQIESEGTGLVKFRHYVYGESVISLYLREEHT